MMTLYDYKLKVVSITSSRRLYTRAENPNDNYDFDSYEIFLKGLSTREIFLKVDYLKKEVSGEIDSFGRTEKLDELTVMDLLGQLKMRNKIRRDFNFN